MHTTAKAANPRQGRTLLTVIPELLPPSSHPLRAAQNALSMPGTCHALSQKGSSFSTSSPLGFFTIREGDILGRYLIYIVWSTNLAARLNIHNIKSVLGFCEIDISYPLTEFENRFDILNVKRTARLVDHTMQIKYHANDDALPNVKKPRGEEIGKLEPF